MRAAVIVAGVVAIRRSRTSEANKLLRMVGGEVALPEGADRARSDESLDSAGALNPQLLNSQSWLGSVLPIGDGVCFAARL